MPGPWVDIALHPSRFDSGEIEQRIDELLQAQAVAQNHCRSFAPTRAKRLLQIGERNFNGLSIRVSGVRNSWLTLAKN